MALKFAPIASVILTLASLVDSVQLQRPLDCGDDQYYETSKPRCANCSGLPLFQSYQEWISREVGNAKELGRMVSGERNRPSDYGSREPSRFSDPSGTDGVLSKLISLDPPSQDYTEEPTGDSGEPENASETTEPSEMSSLTRQTVRLVDRFIQSPYVGKDLQNAVERCRANTDVEGCQKWANMCVMTMYSHSDNSMSSRFARGEAETRTSTSDTRGRKTWQRCKQFSINSICDTYRDWFRAEKKSSTDVQNIYATDEWLTKANTGAAFRLNQQMQLLAYMYSADGKLIKIDQFSVDDMERFCIVINRKKLPQTEGSHIKVGGNMKLNCQFSANQGIVSANSHFNETIFIDLFLAYPSNGAMFVKPVPILIKNLLFNGNLVNIKYARDPSRWKLAHRFFFQTVIASDNGDQIDGIALNSTDDTILFAKSVFLDLRFKRLEKGALLSSILLTLDYGQLQRSYHANNISSTISEKLLVSSIAINQQLIDMQTYKKDLDLIITISCILSSIWSLIKTYNIQKCHGAVKLDLVSLFRFLVISCDAVANLIVVITLLLLTYLFVSLKVQSSVQTLAPTEDLEDALIVNLQLAFAFKLIGLAQKLYDNVKVDVFFVDWEKPKMLTSGQLLNHFTQYNKSEQIGNSDSPAMQKQINPSILGQQASFWRPYTVINRWLQMQTLRRQDMTLQLVAFTCIVEGLRLSDLATAVPDWGHTKTSDNGQYQMNPSTCSSFRLYVLAVVFLAISACQISLKKYFHEPMIRSSVREFVDLCSVANVSLFCMLYPRFGYYIHGRNANGSGDCGIAEMNALLEREERDLCCKRGLVPNSDQQTFLLILPKIINDHYRKLLVRDDLSPASTSQTSGNQATPTFNGNFFDENKFSGGNFIRSAMKMSLLSASARPSSFSSNRANIESTVAKNRAVNTFLINFLEHVYKDIDYSIRECGRFENTLLDVDFDDENSAAQSGHLNIGSHEKSTAAAFCKDSSDSFTSLLWLGLESDLILVELLTVLIVDQWLGQPLVVTTSLVWILQRTFKRLYTSSARRNLVTKALVDEKFLLR